MIEQTPINSELIILLGDVHGDWHTLFKKLEHFDVKDCLIVHVGDLGIGFHGGYERDMVKKNRWFKSRNIHFLAIRGNHDNPAYFNGSINFSHFKLLEDYTQIKINNELWQFVGGAISVDRKAYDRQGKRIRFEGKGYWKDEVFVFKPELTVKCDVLICHTAPLWLGPSEKGQHMDQYYLNDLHLKSELIEERKQIQNLLDICRPRQFYCGHFHRSEWNEYNGDGYTTYARILDILEITEYKKKQ